jgi:hypothetical protein
MLTRGHLTGRLQRRLSGIARRRGSRSLPCDRSAQVVRELSRRDSLLLNVLANSAEHRGRNGTYYSARVLATHPGNIAHSLRHGIVMIPKHLRKSSGPLWIFRLIGGFEMDGVRPARVRVRRYCSGHQWDRGIHRPLRHDWIDAKPLTHLLDSRVADLLVNLFLNRVENRRHRSPRELS